MTKEEQEEAYAAGMWRAQADVRMADTLQIVRGAQFGGFQLIRSGARFDLSPEEIAQISRAAAAQNPGVGRLRKITVTIGDLYALRDASNLSTAAGMQANLHRTQRDEARAAEAATAFRDLFEKLTGEAL